MEARNRTGGNQTIQKIKRVPASASGRPPGPSFQQRTNTSCQLALPTHGFTVVLSVFGGTPLLKPLICKICFLVRAAMNRSRAHHNGDRPMLVFAKFSLSPTDITGMSLYVCSQSLCLWLIPSNFISGKTKNPAYFRKQGWEKILVFYLLTSGPSTLPSLCPITDWRDRPRPNARPRL